MLLQFGNAFCQEHDSAYRTIIQKNKIGKTYVYRSKTDTVWRTYLGVLIDTTDNSTYHVISEFAKIRAASTWHGQSNVFLLNKQGEIIWTILIGMPDELPIKLMANSFYFKDEDKVINSRYGLVGNLLFCVLPNRCYEVVCND
jgi:hypothetical protein